MCNISFKTVNSFMNKSLGNCNKLGIDYIKPKHLCRIITNELLEYVISK